MSHQNDCDLDDEQGEGNISISSFQTNCLFHSTVLLTESSNSFIKNHCCKKRMYKNRQYNIGCTTISDIHQNRGTEKRKVSQIL